MATSKTMLGINQTSPTHLIQVQRSSSFQRTNQRKVRGPRRDILFINEANNVPYETFVQLEIRTREVIWIDYNPVAEFWYYTEVAPNLEHDF